MPALAPQGERAGRFFYLWLVKKQHWLLGFILSVGISLIAFSPRLLRMQEVDVKFLVVGLLYNFVFCFSCWIVYQFLFYQWRLLKVKKQGSLYAAVAIFAVALLTFPYDYFFSIFTPKAIQFPEISGGKRPLILLLRGLLVSGLFFFINYYLHILAEKQRNQLELEQLKQAQLAANLSSLKEQLSPHFLFNTLNTLSTLTEEPAVKQFVSELANVYRYVLHYKELDAATIRQELTFLDSYLYILSTRLEKAMEVEIKVDKAVEGARIPPLALQLLIENALKHNIASLNKPLKVTIRNDQDGYLVVSNTFQPRSSVPTSNGIGLANLMQRYQLVFNKEIVIEPSEQTFTVKLPIIK